MLTMHLTMLTLINLIDLCFGGKYTVFVNNLRGLCFMIMEKFIISHIIGNDVSSFEI